MPTSFLVDAKGVIRAVHYGWRGEETAKKLESEIAELLREVER
jgi:peroxiredoxin